MDGDQPQGDGTATTQGDTERNISVPDMERVQDRTSQVTQEKQVDNGDTQFQATSIELTGSKEETKTTEEKAKKPKKIKQKLKKKEKKQKKEERKEELFPEVQDMEVHAHEVFRDVADAIPSDAVSESSQVDESHTIETTNSVKPDEESTDRNTQDTQHSDDDEVPFEEIEVVNVSRISKDPFAGLEEFTGYTDVSITDSEIPPSVERSEKTMELLRTSLTDSDAPPGFSHSTPAHLTLPPTFVEEDSIAVEEENISPVVAKRNVPNQPIEVQTDQLGFSYHPQANVSPPTISPVSPLTPSYGVTAYSRPTSSTGSETSPHHLDRVHPIQYGDVAESERSSVDSGTGLEPPRHHGHFVVVAIDFGTTFSGYAFSFTRDPNSIHMMRKWEGGDPGVINQKTPTSILLTPEGQFHSFGFSARDFFHDLDPQESKKWLYFEKFKMVLHYSTDLGKETMLKASNGKLVSALTVFSMALRFFKEHALQELTDQSATKILNDDVRWVITVPAIWRAPAKQFMREAAYHAGIASLEFPDQLLIALEPEAASIYCRKLRLHQLIPESPTKQPLSPKKKETHQPLNMQPVAEFFQEGSRYMVVDCGGGTVDITVHEMDYSQDGGLKELWKATGGPYGSVGVDIEFEKLLNNIFGKDFMDAFKYKRPAGYVDLMIAFESRKRTANPLKTNALNVSLPFSYIDYYKKYRNSQVETAIRKYGDPEIRWSSQGMMRFTPEAMRRLFLPTLDRIKQSIGDVLNNPSVKDVKYMFLVGGFAESAILQMDLKREFSHLLRIIIPQDVALTILKGAVLFGMDPTIVSVRKCRATYGVGVLNRFTPSKHPANKKINKDGVEWCTDVFDKFVAMDQSVALGDTVLRSYTPAKPGQKNVIINIYSSERNDVKFITDDGVRKCGTLCLDLSELQYQALPRRREIQTRMTFGDTEIKLSSLDVATGKCVRAAIDFLNK